MARSYFTQSCSAFVLSILAAVVLLFAAGSTQASTYTGLLVDRGLPTFGAYAANGGGTDWANRTNISTGDFDASDPHLGRELVWSADGSRR